MYTDVNEENALIPSHVMAVQDFLDLLMNNSLAEIFIIASFPGDLQRYTTSARVFLFNAS